jgi:hypothetical protein
MFRKNRTTYNFVLLGYTYCGVIWVCSGLLG